MKTVRAKRLEKYLDEHGWETHSGVYVCKKCGHRSYQKVNFCPDCGSRMPTKQEETDTVDVLEEAIAYALKEKK